MSVYMKEHVYVVPVEHYRFFHRVTQQLLNLIPLTEKQEVSGR